ncbi:MAG: DUF997 family protein [Verrucomicrobiales bacterium]
MPGPTEPSDEGAPVDLDPDFLRSRREATWIVLLWGALFAWTFLYGKAHAFAPQTGEIETVAGMPRWVFWGIAVPWLTATLASVGFAAFVMRDHALEAVEGEGDEESSAGGKEGR